MSEAESRGQKITKAKVAEMIGVNKSQITRDLQKLMPDSKGKTGFDRQAGHGGKRVKRSEVERIAQARETIATILASVLTPTKDNPHPTMSDALEAEVRALRDLCNTALTGAGVIS